MSLTDIEIAKLKETMNRHHGNAAKEAAKGITEAHCFELQACYYLEALRRSEANRIEQFAVIAAERKELARALRMEDHLKHMCEVHNQSLNDAGKEIARLQELLDLTTETMRQLREMVAAYHKASIEEGE